MEMRVIGIDLSKSVFHLVGMDQHGKVLPSYFPGA
jgi:hypothetical protein